MTAVQRIAHILDELSPSDRAALLARLPATERIRLSAIHRTLTESASRRPIGRAKPAHFLAAIVQEFIDTAQRASRQPSEEFTGNAASSICQFGPLEVATALRDELPRTSATVIQTLPAAFAAQVLVKLSFENRKRVIECIIETREVSPKLANDVAIEVSASLRQARPASSSNQSRPIQAAMNRGGIAHLQAMLFESTPEIRMQLSASIERADTGVASQLELNRSA